MTLQVKQRPSFGSEQSKTKTAAESQSAAGAAVMAPCSVIMLCGTFGCWKYFSSNRSNGGGRGSSIAAPAPSSNNLTSSTTKKFIRWSLVVLIIVYLILFRSAHRIIRKQRQGTSLSSMSSAAAITMMDPFGFFQDQQRHHHQEQQQQPAKHQSASGGLTIAGNSSSSSAVMTSYNHTSLYRRFTADESSNGNIWTSAEKMPQWMKDYMDWHQEQRRLYLNETHWTELRYMVMVCINDLIKCGGTSDRLKPLPIMLRAAASSKRLLLVYWNRPCALEEFLLPPVGGLDWRVPAFLVDKLINEGVLMKGRLYKGGVFQASRFITVHYQSYDGGAGPYNELLERDPVSNETVEASFEDVFYDVWRSTFTPSPPIASTILEVMKKNNLRPGHYISAHVRLLYFKSFRINRMIEKFTQNAVNCASTLRPGHPIFLASDASYANEYGQQYGKQMNVPVVVHSHNPDPPLHLDRPDGQSIVPNSTASIERPPSDFYDTFVDLYMLALGGCSFFGKGGYGLWAAMIGGENMKCKYQERLKNGVPEHPCTFEPGPPLGGSVSSAQNDFEIRSPFLEPMSP